MSDVNHEIKRKFTKVHLESERRSASEYTAFEGKLQTTMDKKYIIPLENRMPVKVEVTQGGGSVSIYKFTRGYRFRKKQSMVFRVENDHDKFFRNYSVLELLLNSFLKRDMEYSSEIGESDNIATLYSDIFTKINIDCLPEMMYYINDLMTMYVMRWMRFKRLFAAIDLNVDPITVDTVKYKFFQYLISVNDMITIGEEADGSAYIERLTSAPSIHKVMDLFIYMPHCYLFYVYKSMTAVYGANNRPDISNFIEQYSQR